MNGARVVASAFVSLTGAALTVPNALALVAGGNGLAGTALAALGVVLGLALVAGGYGVYWLDMSPTHTLRVAGWNVLGLVVLGLVLVLAYATDGVSLPLFAAAAVLEVSAVAHVLIGVNDVQRIRVGEVERERKKVAVLNRVLRHNLRNESQVILGAAGRLAETTDDESADLADWIVERATVLGSLSERAGHIQELVDGDDERVELDLSDVVDAALEECRDSYPEATLSADVPSVAVRADPNLQRAVAELIRNGVEHDDGGSPTVAVTATVSGDEVALRVTDEGPGLPETERAVVTGDDDVTQLTHASGLGLWLVTWTVEESGGSLSFETPEDGGTTAVVRLPRA